MKPYQQLTAAGQTRRLRPMALQALTHYDLEIKELKLITNGFNGIFKVTTPQDRHYMLRICLPIGGHDLANLRSEMAWLSDLSHNTAFTAPAPVYTRTGAPMVEISVPGVPEPRLCALFQWVPGTLLGKRYSPTILYRWGELMAHLHRHATGFQPPEGFQILSFDKIYPFNDPFIVFDAAYAVHLPPARRAVYEEAVAWAQQAIDRLKASGEPMRVIHGDLHSWNLCFHQGRLNPIDFEDLMWGWPIQDIATTFYYLDDEPDYPELCAAFKEGYTHQAPWPGRHPDEINAFIAVRAVGMVNLKLQSTILSWKSDTEEFAARVETRLRKLLATAA